MLKSKLHRCRVTQANLYYKGSITIDSKLLAAADILEYEKVEVLNLNNGQRIETYAIKGKPGSGVVCLNGPAARGACVGDEVIVVSYAQMDEARAKTCVPRIIHVNERNRIKN
jgi:aspartate 1-decarboxylase